jgi:glycosyltransferase involved in cell wall biosynthesis
MKILQVIPFFSPKFGGSVTVPYELSKELVKHKHDVTIITTDFGFDLQYADTIRTEGVPVISFPCIANFGLFLYSPTMKIWLDQNLKGFDIIHLHNFRSYQNIVIRTFAMKYGIPYIVQAHGSVLPFFEKQNLKKLFDFVWGDKILTDAVRLIAVSKVEKAQYLKMGVPESKIEIIPNGIDVSEYTCLPERGVFRKKHGIASGEKIILYLGRLHKSKGIDFLISGFSSLLDHNNNVKLVVAGPDDGFYDILIQQVKNFKIDNSVIFTGPLYKNEKWEAFVDADMLIYPGILEIFGLVPFEAIMCGTPVIVTDDCGCGGIMKEEHCGFVVKFGDVNQLKDQIKKIIDNPEESSNFVANGQEYINKNLNWANLIRKFEFVYNRCI